ncbi:MAG TPA: heavy metal-associated domain-containing protein, partial [Gelidibacter sp.]|uniref:heavy-metal-associated domain-containing protein n=1 Tax=Gelidibacter sp. TaxID=2018083 RepID=UPI002CC01A1F
MKHTYSVQGMTCNGCRSHVEKTLSEVEGVSSATVLLDEKEAIIEMQSHIPIEKFQEALKNDGGRYHIYNVGEEPHPSEIKAEKKPEGKGTGT